jgi:hypothetical protein
VVERVQRERAKPQPMSSALEPRPGRSARRLAFT